MSCDTEKGEPMPSTTDLEVGQRWIAPDGKGRDKAVVSAFLYCDIWDVIGSDIGRNSVATAYDNDAYRHRPYSTYIQE